MASRFRVLTRPLTLLAITLLAATCLASCTTQAPAPTLPTLHIDPDRVAVAGLSSGAYMATQAHLALGDRIDGAALIAGGPYGCAGGSLQQALGPCMKAAPAAPEPAALVEPIEARASDGTLAPLATLAGDRVLVLHGSADEVVAPALATSTGALYRQLAERAGVPIELAVDTGRDFGHAMPTESFGSPCLELASPFIGRCGFDGAGLVFGTLFGTASPAATATGELRRFDQRSLVASGSDPQLADEGFIYVPTACTADSTCGLLVVFHGCEQNADSIGDLFAREAGFNRWADAAGVVVLYPQTRASFVPLNPKACWDWWGYTGSDYDTRHGAQLRWLDAALDAIGVPAR